MKNSYIVIVLLICNCSYTFIKNNELLTLHNDNMQCRQSLKECIDNSYYVVSTRIDTVISFMFDTLHFAEKDTVVKSKVLRIIEIDTIDISKVARKQYEQQIKAFEDSLFKSSVLLCIYTEQIDKFKRIEYILIFFIAAVSVLVFAYVVIIKIIRH